MANYITTQYLRQDHKSLLIMHDHKICKLPIYLLAKELAGTSNIQLLKNTSLRFVNSNGPLVILVTVFGYSPRNTKYRIITFQPNSCKIIANINIGNPDYIIELGWSPKGGWWITGVTETTLLRPKDGKHWKAIQLPNSISELFSAYIQDDDHIWLAADDNRIPLVNNRLLIIDC